MQVGLQSDMHRPHDLAVIPSTACLSGQQDIGGARPPVPARRGREGQYGLVLDQPLVGLLLEHRLGLPGTPALSMNDPDTAQPALKAGLQEPAEGGARLGYPHAMQVQGLFRRDQAPLQIPEYPVLDARALKLEEFGGLHIEVGEFVRGFLLLPFQRAGRLAGPVGLRPVVLVRLHIRHGLAKQAGIVLRRFVVVTHVMDWNPKNIFNQGERGSGLSYSYALVFQQPYQLTMRILLSNDDGYMAPGLRALADALESTAQLDVVAPDRDRSGASNSLTLEHPLRARAMENGFIRVEGTPTDCVHLAITGLLGHEPDMVIAGINSGPNMGDDVIYSGTVAAATEGRFLGYPAIAISMASHEPRHYESGARVAVELVERLSGGNPLGDQLILNVNVPDLPWESIAGFMATRLGHRHKAEPVVRERDPRGRPIYWVGAAGPEADAGKGTDFHAVRHGYVSITPIQVDLTRHAAVSPLAEWLTGW